MIRVHLPPAPPHYEGEVRTPGQAFLAANPHPSRSDWQRHRYWSNIHPFLYSSLRGICSYCATFTPRRSRSALVDHTSIDHFIPKSRNPALGYEWTNFRLCRVRLNNRKDNFEDVLDPCAIQNGWFRLNFTTFALLPHSGLPEDRQREVRDSIARLALNDDDAYVNERARAVYSYADGRLSIAQVARLYPFIATEIVAQNFDVAHLPTYRSALENPRLRGALIRQGWVV